MVADWTWMDLEGIDIYYINLYHIISVFELKIDSDKLFGILHEGL